METTEKKAYKQIMAERRKQTYQKEVKKILKEQFVNVSETVRGYEEGYYTQEEFNNQIIEEICVATNNLLKLRLNLLGNAAREEFEKVMFGQEF
jgi:DNA-directed RNA polymerase beta' subunit